MVAMPLLGILTRIIAFVSAPSLPKLSLMRTLIVVAPLSSGIVISSLFATAASLTKTVTFAVSVQPLASVAVTKYCVVAVGDTVMGAVVAVLFHTYVVPPLAVKIVFSPLLIVVSPVIEVVGAVTI